MSADNKQEIVEAIAGAEEIKTVLPEGCPVAPLGFCDGVYHFLSAAGEIRSRPVSALKDVGLLDLFGGNDDWMRQHYPRYSQEDEEGNRRVVGYVQSAVQKVLIAACVAEGKTEKSLIQHKCGVWPSEDGSGGLVVHCGDVLYHNGQKMKAGRRIGNAIYGLEERIKHLDDIPATKENGQFLLETLKMWNFERFDLDATLLVGFIGQGMLGAAPGFRAHVMVNGMNGSGKSVLADAVSATLGAAAHPSLTNFTEGGLRQTLTGHARCMVLDEAEPDQTGRVEAVVELLRHMASRGGSRGVRGSAGGSSQNFNVTGCAYLSSILGVALKPADKQRITLINVNPLPPETPATQSAEIEKRITQLAKLSPKFRRRMVDRWDDYQAIFGRYRTAFMEIKGEGKLSGREGDQISTLLAAADILLNDDLPTSDDIDEMIAASRALVFDAHDVREDGEGPQCLSHMLSFIVDNWSGGGRMTLGQMIIDAINDGMGDGENKKLGTWGIKFESDPLYGEHNKLLLISTRHAGLEKVFAGTRWANGVWTQGLRFLGAEPWKKIDGSTRAARFGGASSKAIILPKQHWPRKESDA